MVKASAFDTAGSGAIPGAGAPALRAAGLVKRFGARRALDDVSLEVAQGASAGLVGANGAGKTTFIKCALDLCAADAGRVEIFGVGAGQLLRARLAYVPERFVPPHYLLGREFLAMTLALAGAPYRPERAAQLAMELELDPQALERPVRQLSKGMTQKLGLAACFLLERDLYVLDEPMSGLDPAGRLAVKSALARLRDRGCALFFTSHVLSDVEELCSTIAVLDRGRLRFRGAPADLRRRYDEDNLERAFLKCIRSDADALQSTPEDRPRLLIVDDDALITDTLSFALGAEFEVLVCESRPHAIELLRQLPEAPELALVDLGLPPTPHAPDQGFRLIADLLAHSPAMRIFVLSGQNDAAHARHARALGAAEFIAKPCDPAALKKILARALAVRQAELGAALGPAHVAEELIGQSPALLKLKSQLAQFADSPFPVLIEGESGSGKEMVARDLHRLSSRADRPYFALNCAAIAPTLVEPALFGHAKGAFTGAANARQGYFEDASEGTLFLDEIGELPLELQAKLLRVLENGEYQRVGETTSRVSRARVIAASNRDLRQEVRKGTFRPDLYHRLSVFTLGVPPLREMEGDKLLLLEHFRRFYTEQSGTQPFSLDASAERRWLDYPFPGNVRELRNIVIRLTTKHAGRRLSAADLEPEFDLEIGAADDGPPGEGDVIAQAVRHLERSRGIQLDRMLQSLERGYIEAALKLTRGNVSQAAKLLGVNRTTLYSRMSDTEEKDK